MPGKAKSINQLQTTVTVLTPQSVNRSSRASQLGAMLSSISPPGDLKGYVRLKKGSPTTQTKHKVFIYLLLYIPVKTIKQQWKSHKHG